MSALRLGTRGSTLARLQSGLVADLLREAGLDVELMVIVTEGDVRPPDTAWGEGAFVGALEGALAEGSIDLAVHSAKDVPLDTRLPVAAYPVRADPLDALVCRDGRSRLVDLPAGSRVGTDSPRRTGFLRAARPDLRVVPLHGNVDTRLRRLGEGAVDALVLAVAGLERLGRADRIDEILPADVLPPAPGQGALAVQVRPGSRSLLDQVAAIDDPAVRQEVECERAILRAAGGGCRAPIGASAVLVDGRLAITAGVVEPDGTGRLVVARNAFPMDAGSVADEIAAAFRAAGYRPSAVA